ncbi:prepilin-type N-terminal cleavage/methylation domain-containing protein [Candidatus Gracilibacteria bacterium]|nr:prepilin-type N-terminal cleavage/methylation domain-containing protein [Candidatus Gracilibacteria bacterium]
MIKEKKGFTLIEMMISITVFSMIIVMAFEAMSNIGFLRLKISDRLDLNKDLYYSIENFVSLVKEFNGEIDYEEYFNRRAVGDTQYQSGHYQKFTGFGNYGNGGGLVNGILITPNNYGSGFYYCRSSAINMRTGGCLDNDFNDGNAIMSGTPQRFGEYAFQFIDYNSNMNSDLGDEDGDGNIRGDDDDENLGSGPEAFSGTQVKELYFIKNGIKKERLYFRLNYKLDPDAPPGSSCTSLSGGIMSGSGCLGNIQMLKLIGKDLGLSHTGTTNADGIIDTWTCDSDYNCTGSNNLPTGANSEWVDILPEYINIKNANFYLYPNKNYLYSWKEDNANININPYLRINMTVGFSWIKRKQIKMSNQEVNISTTINLNKTK